MKKLFALLLALVMALSLAACGGNEKPPVNEDAAKSSERQTQSGQPAQSEPAESEPAESEPAQSEPAQSESSDKEKSMAEKADVLAASFGTYNGQPITWRVLDIDVQKERALLITKDCLTELQFHAEAPEDLTYRASDLRVWLVGDFHYSSFTDEEKERIIEVENPQDTNSETGAREPEGYETTDTVFILSASEMQQYFADDEDMAGFLNGEDVSYWTRTPGNDTTGYVCTYAGGGLYMTGNQADSTGVAVRPAVWVNLSKEADPAAQETFDSGASDAAGTAPEGWPENEHTRLVPMPTVGGKVLKADSIGTMFTIDLDWTMEQGTTYAGQLAEAGFGEDAAEKFAQQGYIDRTADGVNVQLLEIGGKVNISIMETE